MQQKPGTGRTYRMRERLARMDETRRRITEAAFELHAEIGPARTTISAVAERAGVQRHTVYRHFPDLTSLIRACTHHGMQVSGVPDPSRWLGIADPAERLDTALAELYRHYRRHDRLLENVLRDVAAMPELVDGSQEYAEHTEAMFRAVASGWSVRGRRRRLLDAAIGHALDYWTWRSLTRLGMTDAEARVAMTRFVLSAAG